MEEISNIKVIITEDGSHSLHLAELDETYHSIHGAIQESNHVFIEAGLNYLIVKNLNLSSFKILEFGFGTGLNALLTARKSSPKLNISYNTLERFPLPAAVTKSLNYGEILNEQDLFNKIHFVNWEEENFINTYFSIKKIKVDFRDFYTKTRYDLIYFDAFAPSKQPEVWDILIFEKCYQLLNTGGVLVTYSAKGQLKRNLKSIGYRVESIPGPPGKFEMTRAIKTGG